MQVERKSQNPQAWRHRPSQRLLFSALVFIIVLALVVSFTLASLSSYRRHVELAEQEVALKARLIATAHEQWLAEMHNLLASMAVGVAAMKDFDAECQPLLHKYLSVSDGVDTVLVLDTRGDMLCSSLPGNGSFNFSDRLYFQRAIKSKRFSVGRFIIGRVSGERVLPMAYPLLDSRGEVSLMLVAGRRLDWINSILVRQYIPGEEMSMAVVDGDGTVMAQGPDTSLALEQPYPVAKVRQLLKQGQQGTTMMTMPDGAESLLAYTSLGPSESDVFVLVWQSVDRILQPTLDIVRSNLLQFIVTMLIVIGALWFGLGHWVLAPLQRLADSMGLVRSGSTGVRVEDMGPSRELVAIGENFNDMLYSLEVASEKLRRLADNDSLLGIPNRRLLDERLHSEWRRLSRSNEPLGLLMIDVDLFKNYNDHYGHQAGDECLKKVSGVLRSVLNRPADLVARYGGEEFVVLLPETDEAGAWSIAERIQEAMAKRRIPHAASRVADHVTLSIGVATTIPTPDAHVDALLESADQGLYRAKENGRNRIEMG